MHACLCVFHVGLCACFDILSFKVVLVIAFRFAKRKRARVRGTEGGREQGRVGGREAGICQNCHVCSTALC